MPFLIAFLCPIFIILIFNVIMCILIIRVLVLHTMGKIKRKETSLTASDSFKMLASYSSIMVLFGLAWLFAVFTFITEPSISFIVQFFFCLFNILQGFFIFFFFIVLSNDSRDAWRSLFSKQKVGKKYKTTQSNVSLTKQNMPSSSFALSDFAVPDKNNNIWKVLKTMTVTLLMLCM